MISSTELRHLAEMYLKITKELDDLKSDYQRISVQRAVYNEVENFFTKGSITTHNGFAERRYIIDQLLSPEIAAINQKDSAIGSKMFHPDTQLIMSYLEKKLDVIKTKLGNENVEKIEIYKTESFIKNLIDSSYSIIPKA